MTDPAPEQESSAGSFVLFGCVAVFGALAATGVHGYLKFVRNAKQAEAKNALGEISKDAVMAYEATGHVCPSASRPVPADTSAIRGKVYASSPSEWAADKPTKAGFACLAWSMALPQRYQYEYEATPTSFVARAHGDLDGDGVVSTYEFRGALTSNGHLLIEPRITEIDPDE